MYLTDYYRGIYHRIREILQVAARRLRDNTSEGQSFMAKIINEDRIKRPTL